MKRTTKIKEEMNNNLENIRRWNQMEILEIKSPYSQTKKQWKAPHQNRTSGRLNLRVQR
jgi:hypothetical protein